MSTVPDRDPARGPLGVEEYARYRFQYYPTDYFQVLQILGIERLKPIRVLDIGCGPGNWTIAIAEYNKNAQVIGIDPDDNSIRIAEDFKERFQCKNASFARLGYREVDSRFPSGSFDYVISMGVFMFLDEDLYFRTVSKLLRMNGRLIMLWNHGIGYYFEEATILLKQKRLKELYCSVHPVAIGLFAQNLLGGDHEHPISYRRTRRIATRHGIDLHLVHYTQLCFKFYNEKFQFLPIILNMIGQKTHL